MSGLGIRQDSGSGRAGTPPMKLDKDETPTSNKYR